MTAALKGGEWSAARPGRTLTPGKNQYPFYRRLGGPQGRSGSIRVLTVKKSAEAVVVRGKGSRLEVNC